MTNFLRHQSSVIGRWCFNTGAKAHRRPFRIYRNMCHMNGNLETDQSWKSMEGIMKCPVNYVPLTPITFLDRAAKVYRDRTSVVYGSFKCTWEQTRFRCVKLASALAKLGVSSGDVVATLAPNIPAMQELHFAVPMAGGVICTLNTRHDSAMISVLLQHSEAKIVFVDYQLLHVVTGAFDLLSANNVKPPILVLIPDYDVSSHTSSSDNTLEYESLLARGDCEFVPRRPETEWHPISINYTSGTTSRPKGVIYNHRGAYLNALATASIHGMVSMPTYLWTVPMFHCNAWCLVWGLAALGGTNICLRHVSPKEIFEKIEDHKVTHMSAAPTVLNMIINADEQRQLPHKVEIMTGGAPPPPTILSKIEKLGFLVSHSYGLTETYGAATSCVWKPEWDYLAHEEQSRHKSRQGMEHYALEEVDVRDSVTMEPVPADGITIGEIMIRGNTVMSGYLKDVKATKEAFAGGWFHSGDLAVKHVDGYIEVKDRLKDIIISGGENICSIEVERVLYGHPAVLEAAMVARPDNHWGQTPCAFVKLKEESDISSQEIIEFCRNRVPHYMAPKTVVFKDLPKTSTGKIQKVILREQAKAMGSLF